MLWVIHCLDGPGTAELRAATRPAHSARLRTTTTRPLYYGPLLADDGTGQLGSLFVLDAANRREAEEFVRADPFTTAGVWQHISIHAFAPSERSTLRAG